MQDQRHIETRMVEPLKTGELFVREGLIRLKDIDMVLSIQEKREASLSLKKSRLFGMILCDLNLITPMDNYYVLNKYNKLLTLQSALVSRHILTKNAVIKAQVDSEQQEIPLISFLLKKELVSTIGMQRLLFDLFHIPFRSISDFTFNESDRNKLAAVLDEQASGENKMIPLSLEDNTLLFGMTDPDNILFLRQLNDQFPQYRFKLQFIPFSGYSWFYQMIYNRSNPAPTSSDQALDAFFLLSYKIEISDPDQEGEAIQTLYQRYEQLRYLAGNPKRDNRHKEFREFIIQHFHKISREYKSHSIEFSLKKENRDVNVMAYPNR